MLGYAKVTPVNISHNPTGDKFKDEIQKQRKPCIIQGVNIGDCVTKWTPDYLIETVGSKPVNVSVYETPLMTYFNENEYSYESLPFNELVKRCHETHHTKFFKHDRESYYMRSTGENEKVSNFHEQFPRLAKDIKFPNFFEKEQFHSSTFRIASNFQLLTHYDAMDNILIQVRGRKRVILFDPCDFEKLYPREDDKTHVFDIDNPDLNKYPEFAKATQHEAILNSGDIIFIPAFWYHNVTSLEPGVAVNVFWKNLDSTLYKRKDYYGNKDLIPVAQAINSLNNSFKDIEKLPPDVKNFCGRRMISLIKARLIQNDQA